MISLRSKITQQVLSDAFLNEKKAFYVNEIARRHHLDSGNVARKLKELESDGILQSETKARARFYSLNPRFPLLKEYRQIVLKTVGIESSLKKILKNVRGIQKAFLFGSYAAGTMEDSSDLDLMVIGGHRLIDLHRQIAKLQKDIGRPINVTSVSAEEYEKKRASDNFFRSLNGRPKVNLL